MRNVISESADDVDIGNRPRRYLIIGVRSTMNLGIMAIITSSIRQLERIGRGAYSIVSLSKDVDKAQYDRSLPSAKIKIVGIRRRESLPYPIAIIAHFLRAFPEFMRTDVVIDMSGETPPQAIPVRSVELLTSRLFNKKTIILSQSFYEYSNPFIRRLERFVLNGVGLLIVRDRISLKYLQAMNLRRPVLLAADPAFLLPKASDYRVSKILREERIPGEKRILGLSPTLTSLEAYPNLAGSLAKFADWCTSEHGFEVVLIPHAKGPVSDDSVACRIIKNLSKSKESVHILEKTYTPEEVKGIIAKTEAYVSFRMHAAIASVSSRVPTVLVMDLHKAQMMAQFGLGPFIVSQKNLTFRKLAAVVGDMIENLHEVRKQLEQSVPHAETEAEKAFRLVQSFLNEESVSRRPKSIKTEPSSI